MDLTPEQKSTINEWAARGDTLSDIQKQIKKEFDINLTYMDVRLLVLDLEVSIQDKEDPAEAKRKKEQAAAEKAAAEAEATPEDGSVPPAAAPEGDAPAGASSVTVELDTVVVPGALVSGSVLFSDGVKGNWALDQMGRLSLGANDPDYQPDPVEIEEFQKELQRLLQQKGF